MEKRVVSSLVQTVHFVVVSQQSVDALLNDVGVLVFISLPENKERVMSWKWAVLLLSWWMKALTQVWKHFQSFVFFGLPPRCYSMEATEHLYRWATAWTYTSYHMVVIFLLIGYWTLRRQICHRQKPREEGKQVQGGSLPQNSGKIAFVEMVMDREYLPPSLKTCLCVYGCFK